ncbi:MAG: inositol monophosphatase [Alphaproteobacteria bacterium]|nr:inositol monophosphatase [Alphaproteobacteria bacterium]
MVNAAYKAAKGLIRDFGEVEHLQVSKKGPADFVSQADLKSEQILKRELSKARPDYGLLMEEGGGTPGKDSSNRWIIDPLDGTLNFLHGLPHFAISIGVERDGEPFAGVIYNPVNDELYWAEKGQGAHLNERRLRVSARRKMEEALIGTGAPFLGHGDHALFIRRTEAVIAKTAGLRRLGAAALDLAYVASGRLDGFWEEPLHPWDICAGIVLVREAGGYVTEIGGGGAMMASGSVLAANDQLHRPLGDLLRGV